MSKWIKEATTYYFRKSDKSTEPDYIIISDTMHNALFVYYELESSDPYQVLIGAKVFINV